jgi:hypothetical protein
MNGHRQGWKVSASSYRRPGGCRCDGCRAANTARTMRERERRRLAGPPADIEHGASTYNNWGCRCAACTAAHSARCRDYKIRKAAA